MIAPALKVKGPATVYNCRQYFPHIWTVPIGQA